MNRVMLNFFLLAAGLAASTPMHAADTPLLIRAGHLLDVESGKILNDQAISISDGRITAIAPWKSSADKKARQLNWSKYTVVPGCMVKVAPKSMERPLVTRYGPAAGVHTVSVLMEAGAPVTAPLSYQMSM